VIVRTELKQNSDQASSKQIVEWDEELFSHKFCEIFVKLLINCICFWTTWSVKNIGYISIFQLSSKEYMAVELFIL
jgi:hypothetical protein